MQYIKAISFTGASQGRISEAKDSIEIMQKKTACNSVILVIGALQETAHSEYVDYQHDYMITDEELVELIYFIHSLGLQVILKPFVNCKDGTWRAYINFFDKDVVSEPKWGNWFQSYQEFIVHYSEIAEETGCEMLIIGCEMVMSERRETEWRELIVQVRNVYQGLITYNTDKYQEDNLTWWDAVDIISSSGYYPADDWDSQLDRIEAVVQKYNKPFFFAEIGCKSCKGSSQVPNDWTLQGTVDLEEQERFYRIMFEKCSSRHFVQGLGLWDWHSRLYQEQNGWKDKGFNIYGKPACDVVYQQWSQ